MCRRWRGSSPVRGSSRTRTVGSCDEGLGHLDPLAHALGVGRRADGASSGSSSTTARAGGRRHRGRARRCSTRPAGRTPGRSSGSNTRLLLGDEADAPGELEVAAGVAARARCTGPGDGGVSPHSSRSRVDLPAPLGPSRAVTPGPTVNDTSDTATTSPNHFDTSAMTIDLAATAAVPSACGSTRWRWRRWQRHAGAAWQCGGASVTGHRQALVADPHDDPAQRRPSQVGPPGQRGRGEAASRPRPTSSP